MRKDPKEKDGSSFPMGLSEREAQARLQLYGPNRLHQKKKRSPAMVFLRQFKDTLVLILLGAVTLSAAMGEVGEALTILAIVLCNGLLGFIQEYRTERTIDAMKTLTAPSCVVVRDGRTCTVSTESVVPGDLLLLESGDRVAADGRLIRTSELMCDESMLTGESHPVEKSAAPHLNCTEEKCFVRGGTVVVSGRGAAVVTATGMETRMGSIAGMLTDGKEEMSPLQKKLSVMGKQIGIGCMILCGIVAVTGILRGYDPVYMLLTAISLAVAAVPEGLPAIVTIALALAMGRMAKRGALIRSLKAVETLGCATVICTDKTGTLTQNKMEITCLVSLQGRWEKNEKRPLPDWAKKGLAAAVLCSNDNTVRKNPTEEGIFRRAAEENITLKELRRTCRRVREIPFSSEKKYMEVTVEHSGRTFVIRKGAPGRILAACRYGSGPAGIHPLTDHDREKLRTEGDRLAAGGFRVIGVCGGADEDHLAFFMWIAMEDPLKEGVPRAVKNCRRAGIKVKMITGDHLLTAKTVAKQAGILTDPEAAVTGEQLDRTEGSRRREMILKAQVFARVTPEHKLLILRTLKESGEITAMTGDGVNDAPAVQEAHMGVAMGKAGTEVTKEVANLLLCDDDFSTIEAAVEEGRIIYGNIRKFIRYLLSCNIGEVVTMFLGMCMGMPVVLLPMQILMINLVTDGLPALALGVDPPNEDVMDRPPRKPGSSVFSHGLLSTVLFRGCLVGISALGAFVTVGTRWGLECGRTAAFLTLMLIQLVHVFECKSETLPLHKIHFGNNLRLVGAVILSAALGLSAVMLPVGRLLFSTVLPTGAQWILIVGWTLLGPAIQEILWFLQKNFCMEKGEKTHTNSR